MSHMPGRPAETEDGEAAREHIIVVQYDGEAQTEAFLGVAKQACSLVQSGSANLGMGVVSILGFDDSYRIFEARRLQLPTSLLRCLTAQSSHCCRAHGSILARNDRQGRPRYLAGLQQSWILCAARCTQDICTHKVFAICCRLGGWTWSMWTGLCATAAQTSGSTSAMARPRARLAGTRTSPGRSTSTSGAGHLPCPCHTLPAMRKHTAAQAPAGLCAPGDLSTAQQASHASGRSAARPSGSSEPDRGPCRWERSMIAKMVTKLLSGDKDMRPGASMDLGMSRALSSALGTLAPQESGTHPHHIFLAMSDELKQQIGGALALCWLPVPRCRRMQPAQSPAWLRWHWGPQ